MPAYCLWDVREVHDPAAMNDYVERVGATVSAFDGRYLVVGGNFATVEGDWSPTYPVLIEFPSLDAAHAWYASTAYRDLKAQRLAATTGDAVFMDSSGIAHHLPGAA